MLVLTLCARLGTASSVPEIEVNALHTFYMSTQGDSWTYTVADYEVEDGGQPWNFSLPANRTDPCVNKWFGVKCTASADACAFQSCSISQLNMNFYNLQGMLYIWDKSITILFTRHSSSCSERSH